MAIALILGGAECVWDDARRALAMFTPDAVIAVNDMIGLWPDRVDYGVSLHPEKLSAFVRNRKVNGGNTNLQLWSHKRLRDEVHKTTSDWAGSSSLFAVKVALIEEKFDGVVLAGVPMEPEAGHIVRKKAWQSANMFRRGWIKRQSEYEARTRSMSGWTKQLLGEPTPEWLAFVSSASDHDVIARLEKGDAQTSSSIGKAR